MLNPKEGDIVRGYGRLMVVWTANKAGVVFIHPRGFFHVPSPVDGDYIGYAVIGENDLTPDERRALDVIKNNIEVLRHRR